MRILLPFQPPGLANWQTVAKFGNGLDNSLARDIWARPEFGFFRWFASAPALYRIDHHPHGACVWFEDLRFAAPGRESPFRFGLCGPEWQSYRLTRDGQVAPFWPACGIAVAVLLLAGLRLWPGVALGALAATLTMPIPVAAAIPIACFAAGLYTWWRRR